MKLAMLAVGGILGTLARHFLGGAVYRWTGGTFPYGTVTVNLTGCFILGFLAAVSARKFLFSPELQLFLMVGFCGAFTTFSTFILESNNLLVEGRFLQAFLNVFASVLFGLLFFRAGIWSGDVLF
ncbi:MAG: hypothetical protein A2Z83_04005 [Omnitrophica bacterium GWA2_52_8]|nr:MAG: hypothetical protein A2Z83_04005 [Omnitrophica bacterium GWA2_52_8]